MLPPELRTAYTRLVSARHRGKTQLEAARAATAALRSLANGAKPLDEQPGWPTAGWPSHYQPAPP